MKVEFPSGWLKPEDVNDGDKITIKTEAKWQPNERYGGDQLVCEIELSNGETKTANINKTSGTWLVAQYGEDSVDWVGKEVPVVKVKQNVQGKMIFVVYFGELPEGE